jgi:P-type Cu2+ transporter
VTALQAPADFERPPEPRWRALDDPHEQAAFTQWQQAPGGERIGVSQFQISGMHCAACSGLIEAALKDLPGVLDAHVSAASERAEVRWDPLRVQPSRFVEALDRAGYGAVPDAAAPARFARIAEKRKALWRLFVAGFCMMQVMMYATPAYVAPPGDITPDVLRLLQWASWLLSVPVVLFSAGPFFSGAWRSVKARRIGMDVPVAVGIAVTFVASSGATFDPGGVFGHEVYFDSLTMFVFFLLGGRYLELAARHRVAATLESAMQRLPELVERITADGRVEAVSPGRLAAGDRVRVAAGQAFAADGIVLEGRSHADEALLTGESRPVPKSAGDAVVAGSLNLGGSLLMRVERVGADTRYEGIVAMMRSALTQRPAMVRIADRIAGPFLWAVLVLALGAAVVWSFIDPSRAVWVAVSVLIVTCPCALGLAAPSALLAAASSLARQGVLLQRLDAIEAFTRVDTVFLDKTGTLTLDRLTLAGVRSLTARPLSDEQASHWLQRAAALAAASRHPLSQALVRAAAAEAPGEASTPAAPSSVWRDVQERPGQGLHALDEAGREWRLGSRAFVSEQAGPSVCAALSAATGEASDDAQVVFGPTGHPSVAFDLAEALRPDAAEAVRDLEAMGLRLGLLSGDEPGRAARVASAVGIRDVHASAMPEDKLAAVADAQARGHRVAMVGDGLNDAPVLARADLSIALSHGASVARSQADAVLLGDRLSAVVTARRVSERTMRIVRQNLVWAALYNASCIPLALAGWLPPWAAGIGMAASSLFVVLNAQRVLMQGPRKAS